MKLKNTLKQKYLFLTVFTFLLCAGFLLFQTQTAYAADGDLNPFMWAFRGLLHAMLALSSVLLSAAGTLFVWLLNVDSLKNVIDNRDTIYPLWQNVRDILNIAFILVLLFSAFSTIFQVDKYSYKNILLNLVLMALLVNFSYPITRFIIDASNVLMYTLVKNLLGENGGQSLIFLTKFSGLEAIVTMQDPSTVFLLSKVIFTFILAITLLATAVLFIIRMAVLAMLIIFSPLAFVATILPGNSYSGKWWSYLFQYSFFGPVMVFVLYIAMQIMRQVGSPGVQAMFAGIGRNQSINGDFIGSVAMFCIPIIILWLGMGVAQSMSIAGASTVMGSAQKAANWAGKKFSGYSAVKKQYDAYAGARKKREEEKAKNRFGGRLGGWLNDKQDRFTGKIFEDPFRRFSKVSKDKAREDIKKASENLAGAKNGELLIGIEDLPTNQDVLEMELAAMDRKALIEAAGKATQIVSRGAAVEKELERKLREEQDRIDPKQEESDFGNKQIVMKFEDAITKEQKKQREEAIKENERIDKEYKKYFDSREKRIKEAADNRKKLVMDNARAVIKAAENKDSPAKLSSPIFRANKDKK